YHRLVQEIEIGRGRPPQPGFRPCAGRDWTGRACRYRLCVGCKTGTAHESKAGKREPVHDRCSERKMPSTSVAASRTPQSPMLCFSFHGPIDGEGCRPLTRRNSLKLSRNLAT